MKKLYAFAFFTMMILSASARDKVLLNEDFSWVAWTGNLTDCAYNATGEVRYDYWNQAAKAKGWTSKTNWVWTRPYFVKLGKTNYGGDICSPAFTALSKDEVVTATLTFQAVRYCGADGATDANGGKLHVAILNAGRITKISGGMTTGNVDKVVSYTLTDYPNIKSAAAIQLDPANVSGKSTDSPDACWKKDISKYTITIEGATALTQVLFVGGTYNAGPTDRMCIDNVKVVTSVEDDPNDFSTIIQRKQGKSFAVKNDEIDHVTVDHTANVNPEMFEPETVVKYETEGGVPSDFRDVHAYDGPKISLEGKGCYAFDATAYNCKAGQSGAAYGDYLFVVEDKFAAIHMYDLKNNKMLATCKLTPHEETTGDGNSVLYHCNQSSFGTQKYASSDAFPVLYVSQRSHKSDNRCFVNVLRITNLKKNAAGEYASFDVQEVQKIFLPAASSTNGLNNANLTIDPQTGEFYTYSRWNGSGDHKEHCKITRLRIVELSQASPVYLYDNDIDIKDSYYIYSPDGSKQVSAVNMQGAFIWNKKLYISQGYQSCGYINLRVVDLVLKKQVNEIDLLHDGFTMEPEGLFMHDGHMKMSTNGTILYTFYFSNKNK